MTAQVFYLTTEFKIFEWLFKSISVPKDSDKPQVSFSQATLGIRYLTVPKRVYKKLTPQARLILTKLSTGWKVSLTALTSVISELPLSF